VNVPINSAVGFFMDRSSMLAMNLSPEMPATIRADQIVGRWGVASSRDALATAISRRKLMLYFVASALGAAVGRIGIALSVPAFTLAKSRLGRARYRRHRRACSFPRDGVVASQ
jgi:hypothetical protein